MKLIEMLENRKEVLKVPDVARILGISKQQVYKIAAAGTIPHFRVQCAIKFCPAELAEWIKKRDTAVITSTQAKWVVYGTPC